MYLNTDMDECVNIYTLPKILYMNTIENHPSKLRSCISLFTSNYGMYLLFRRENYHFKLNKINMNKHVLM